MRIQNVVVKNSFDTLEDVVLFEVANISLDEPKSEIVISNDKEVDVLMLKENEFGKINE